MNRYSYEGPVMQFERIVQNNWKVETTAPSEKKALSNLSYRWKKENGLTANNKISLPGKLKIVS